MDYPLYIKFKKIALAPQFSVFDANDKLIFYVKQKLFKLKEEIKVYTDRKRENQLMTIKADRIIDISAKYQFFDMEGMGHGSVKRKGLKSFWKANYLIFNESDQQIMDITEKSVFIRVMDAIFSNIPLIGLCAGYVFHPTYLITRNDGSEVMRIRKMPAFLEGKFMVEKLTELSGNDEKQVILSLLMMLLLEKRRG